MKMTNTPVTRQSIWDTFNIRVTSFAPHCNNTLKGYVTVEIEGLDLEISNIGIHKKGSQEWITLPAIPQIKDDGSRNWFQTMEFCDKRDLRTFGDKVLKAYKMFNNPHLSMVIAEDKSVSESGEDTRVSKQYYPQDDLDN